MPWRTWRSSARSVRPGPWDPTSYHTHSLPRRDQRGHADHESHRRQRPPATARTAESNEDGGEDPADDPADAECPGEDHAGSIAVANTPANEIRMGLVAQRPFDRGDHSLKRRRMGRIRQGAQEGGPFFGGEVQLPRRTVGQVNGDDAFNLFAKRLNRN